ncbi:lysylphosphatidylglycerol synthase transmembrane domain-containing protein [Crocosphaera sp. XPORK-15E]|uniref:lysylphosphatidylglycerol synthase transmembrane domain-containing protein n=1 Tax=Crocosphaera sp. XPORK-15E TaxID=3110247 RepID=UPI002B20A34B|nr:lysylphosphatidylglycerol synthase transmembrane domain-containing protein [Crocosphaera sp. XPORK-15E]MEA5536086.1 lysylphosphatidylglycerol synthase transmembrane domain-containing protein [Crocosphaera sp. XPORK-15E]
MIKNNKIIYTIFSLSIGILLALLTLRLTENNVQDILTQLKNLNWFYTSLIPFVTFINFWSLAYRWKLITQKLISDQKREQKFYLFYISLGSLIGIFIPAQVSMLTTQSMALRFNKVGSVPQGLLASLYNQILNLLIPLIFLPTSLLLFFGKISLSVAIFLAAVTLFIGFQVNQKWHSNLIRFFLTASSYIKRRFSRKKIENNKLNTLNPIPFFDSKFVVAEFWLTIILHLNIAIRNFLVVKAIDLNIGFWYILFASLLIYLAMVLSFTPGSLGLMEWSWIGMLGLINVPTNDVVSFALIQRLLITLSIVIVFVVLAIYLWIERMMKAKTNKI